MNLNNLVKKLGYVCAGLAIVTSIYASTDSAIIQANNVAEFDKLLKENKLVVVEFFNPTCPVCMAFKRKGIFAKAAKALPHVKFAMTSSDQGANLHHEYKIKVFPTFIFFRNGKKVGEYKGYVEAPQFIRKVNGIFSAAELNEPEKTTELEQEKG